MKRLIMSLLAACALLTASADKTALVTVNGVTLDKTPVALTFNDDKVIIHFGDSGTTEAGLEDVTLSFAEGVSTIVESIAGASVFRYDGLVGDSLSVSGLAECGNVSIIDMSGKTVIAIEATSGSLEINVADLTPGTYLLRAGKNVVKFVKR